MLIHNYIPGTGKRLTAYKGIELLDRIGEDTVKKVVTNVLCGSNIRALTETLTRKRLALSNASLLITYLKASQSIENFQKNLPQLVTQELTDTKLNLSKEEKQYLQWLVGLTGKSIQNVLRGDDNGELTEYLNELEIALTESAEKATKIFGDLTGEIQIENATTSLSWPILIQIFTAIGAQTLTIRGSEKSIYGKLFEKFILGSLLSILGFSFIDIKNIPPHSKSEMIFWLSSRGDKRESDATAIISLGKGVRFDIGFIGPGNTEISLDKVSRFETKMEFGEQQHYMSTLIIVDRIGERSRIIDMAKEIKGNIIQMSMSFWVRDVAKILQESTGFEHNIINMNDEDTLNFIRETMKNIDLHQFMSDTV